MEARRRYESAVGDDRVRLAELFTLLYAARLGSRVRADVVSTAAGILNQHEPLRNERSGQTISHADALPNTDSMMRHRLVGAPGSIIDQTIENRLTAAANRKRADVTAAIRAAGQAAADAITA